MKASRFVYAIMAGVAMAGAADARTWVVDPLGGGDAPTIAAAIEAASDGDVVELVDGIYRLDGNRDLDFGGKRITVRSQSDDAELCAIDCEGSYEEPHRGFVFHSGEDSLSVLRGVGIIHGSTQEACPGCQGGAIYCTDGSSPTIERCLFRDNVASTSGGAIYCDDGCSPRLRDCFFVSNVVRSHTNAGGGLACGGGFQGPVERCVFSGNVAGNGGGISIAFSTARIVDCRFADNHAYSEGGAVKAQTCTLEVTSCSLSGNSAFFGGGLFALYGETLIEDCTLAANSGHFGAGCFAWDTSVEVVDTIIAFNENGEALRCEGAVGVAVACSDFYGNDDGDWVGCVANLADVNGNLAADPEFCALAAGDLTLFDTSPCLAAHNSCGVQIGAEEQGCVSTVAIEEMPAAGRLALACCPTPFNPRATIAYSVPEAAAVDLAAYDLRGRLVRTLVSGRQEAGPHEIVWDGCQDNGQVLPSGIYVLRLQAGAQSMTRRIGLIR